MLAYINPEEEMMLRQMGGSGESGPGGVPAFRTLGMSPGQAGAMGQGYQGGDKVGSPSGGISKADRAVMRDERLATDNAAVVAQQVQFAAAQKAEKERLAADQLVGQKTEKETSGIMSVVNDVKAGFKNLISDVGMTYAGGIGSFSDLSNKTNYDNQYKKLVDLDYDPAEVTRYLDTTKATQATIREDYLGNNEILEGSQRRRDMKDERLADEARLASAASTAVGTGIDTIPISTSLPSGSGTVGTTYDTTGGFTPSSDFDATTGEIFGEGNTYGAMADGSQLIKILGPGGVIEYQILDPSGSSITNTFDNYQEAYAYATGTPYTPPAPVMPPPSVTPPPVVTPDPIVQPVAEPINTQVPAATVDPMTPVGGDFLLPGQQNYGPTPSAALNFNPNTYMQTPQNASVVLPDMFQKGNAYTFEELLSQYKPAYEPIL